jgi:hypothetical protein
MQGDLIPFININRIQNLGAAPIENNMSSTMFCRNAATRVIAIERCVVSPAAARSCKRSFSYQTQSLIQSSSRTPSTRQLPLSSQSTVQTPLLVFRSRAADRRRTYAADAGQNANTIQGTIGKGASEVGEEAQRVKERLQAPDYLNEKEKMIFEKLDSALEPTRLEVRRTFLSREEDGEGCGRTSCMLVLVHFERLNMWSNMLTIIFKIGSRYLRWMRLNVRD